MSLPWSKSVHLQIAPHRVSGKLARSWPMAGPSVVSIRGADASTPQPATVSPSELDGARLDAVLQELELSGSLRGTRCRVELADALVHFDVAEGQFATQTDRELQAIAAACVGELLGEDTSAYEVRWSLQVGARHLLIAAVPRSYLEPLAAAVAQRGTRLESVQPAFCRQWNAFARDVKARVAIFAVTSGAHVVVACVVAGAVCGISVGPWTRNAVAPATPPGPGSDSPPPTETSLLIEQRATRLFASLGIELDGEPQFILVTPEPRAILASSPWTIVQTSEALR